MNVNSAVLLGSEVGHFVSGNHQRIAEIINDYDSELHLVFVPSEQRDGLDEFPFAIYHHPAGRSAYVVRRVRQEDMNEKLIAWVFMNDQNHNSLEANLAAYDAANEAIRLKKQIETEEIRAALKDFTTSVLKGPNYFRHDGKVYR